MLAVIGAGVRRDVPYGCERKVVDVTKLGQREQLLEQGRAVGNRELREYMAGAGPGCAPRVACSVDRVHVSLWVAEPE